MEDDLESVISSDISYYQVTLACKVRQDIREKASCDYAGYTFICPGPTDSARMERAMCFFDHALLRDGADRNRLCAKVFGTQKCTDICASAMVSAFRSVCNMCAVPGEFIHIFVAHVVAASHQALLHTPSMFAYAVPPLAILYQHCSFCKSCMRVFQTSDANHQSLCPACTKAWHR